MDYEIIYNKIVYFPNIIKNYQELIDLIEKTNSYAVSPWETWYAYNGTSLSDIYGEIKYMHRELLNLEDENLKKTCSYIIESLINPQIESCKKYAEIYNISSEILNYGIEYYKKSMTKFGINKYNTNAFMGPHVDWNEVNNGLLYTVVVYLNDDYEGGELYFNNFNLKIKPKAGSVIIFPSEEPYLHQSLEVLKGRKMLITHHWRKIGT